MSDDFYGPPFGGGGGGVRGYGPPQPQDPYGRPMVPYPQQQPEIDESTRYLIGRSRAMRTKPTWEADSRPGGHHANSTSRGGGGGFSWDLNSGGNNSSMGPFGAASKTEDNSTLSSKTRSMLDKLKESTAALQDLSTEDTDDHMQSSGRQRKPSRFLKKHSTDSYDSGFQSSTAGGRRPSLDMGRMADDILGESLYPPPSSKANRKYSHDTDRDRFSDRSSPDSRTGGGPAPPPTRGRQAAAGGDDDDLDAMISNLKKKTSSRDMYKIVGDIEGDLNSNLHNIGRKSVSPVPAFKPRNQPEQHHYQQQPLQHQKPRFDPYDAMRGGTGYGIDFASSSRPSLDDYYSPRHQQQQQPRRSSYGGAGADGGYGGYGGRYQPAQQQQQQYGVDPYAVGDPYGGGAAAPPPPQMMRMQPGGGGGYFPQQQPQFQAQQGGYGVFGPPMASSRRPGFGYYN